MAELLTLEALFTLFMLILLQAVLGFDNLLYIAIESNKVGDPKDAQKVRKSVSYTHLTLPTKRIV